MRFPKDIMSFGGERERQSLSHCMTSLQGKTKRITQENYLIILIYKIFFILDARIVLR